MNPLLRKRPSPEHVTKLLEPIRKMWVERCECNDEDIVIAGGAVRDLLLGRNPKDYDVFLLDTLDGETLPSMAGWPLAKAPRSEWSTPHLIATTHEDSGAVHQLMHHHAPTADRLLDEFDWNVCRFAFDHEGLMQRMGLNEFTNGKLKLHACPYPLSTLRRGYRFSERFGMPFERHSFQRLLKLCLTSVKGKPTHEHVLS